MGNNVSAVEQNIEPEQNYVLSELVKIWYGVYILQRINQALVVSPTGSIDDVSVGSDDRYVVPLEWPIVH